MTSIPSDFWGFVVDTDRYSGNFECELTAWCTGVTGVTEDGEAFADATALPAGFLTDPDEPDEPGSGVLQMANDLGASRPCAIFPSPGMPVKIHSVVIYLATKPSPKELAWLKDRAHSFPAACARLEPWRSAASVPTIEGFRLVHWVVTQTEETARSTTTRNHQNRRTTNSPV